MKIRLFTIILALSIPAASPAESYRLAGAAVKTRAAVSWEPLTNRLPETVQVYKVLPQTFTQEAMMRAMELAGGFTPLNMKKSADKKTMEWRLAAKGFLRRSLKICPSRGWISIFNQETEAQGTNSPVGVPTFERVDELALQFVQQFGGDTNQLCFRPCYRTYCRSIPLRLLDSPVVVDDVITRGCMYARKLDGISFDGKSSRGGLEVEFGDHEKIKRLEFVWRNLQPYKKYRVASLEQMAEFIKAGQARLPEQNFDPRWFDTAKQIIINDVTLYYAGDPGDPNYDSDESGNSDRPFTFPYATLRTKVILADSTAVECFLDCPILTKEVDEK